MPHDPPSEPGHPHAPRVRALGTFERAQLLTSECSPYNLVVSLKLEGSLGAGRMRTALDELQLQHPSLAVCLPGKPATAAFAFEGVPAIPLRVGLRDGETNWTDASRTGSIRIGYSNSCALRNCCCASACLRVCV